MLESLGQSSYGAMAAFGKNREMEAQGRAEAIRQAREVGSGEEVDAKAREVAEQFVSVFMNQVMKSMRATVPENPAMHGDNGEKFFQDMLDTEQSKSLAKGSGYGLTDLVYQSLVSQQRLARPEDVAGTGDSNPTVEASMNEDGNPYRVGSIT